MPFLAAKPSISKPYNLFKEYKKKKKIPVYINNNINRDVEEEWATGCTGYIHIAAIRMMEHSECFTVY